MKKIKNLVSICAITGLAAFSACTKSSSGSTNYATQYIGSWTVTSSSCGSALSSFVVTAGSSPNSFSVASSVGIGYCTKAITETGTGSASGFVMPPQTFTDGCGNSYTIGTTGTISGSAMSYTVTETFPGSATGTCALTATK